MDIHTEVRLWGGNKTPQIRLKVAAWGAMDTHTQTHTCTREGGTASTATRGARLNQYKFGWLWWGWGWEGVACWVHSHMGRVITLAQFPPSSGQIGASCNLRI